MPNSMILHERMIDDRQVPITGKLVRGGAVVDLTGKTVLFHMVKKDGTVIVNEQSATVVSASGGTVKYNPAAGDVDEDGEFYGWFITVDGSSLRDTFPHDGHKFLIRINPRPS